MQRGGMLSRVWSVCVTERERDRERNGGKSDYFSVVKLFQSLLSPFCQEMRLTLKLRAGRHRRSLPVFQTPHHALSETNFFPGCVWRLWSLPLPQTLHELSLFLQRLLGVESKGEIFSDFLMKVSDASLLRLWHCASLVKSFWGLREIVETVKTVERECSIHHLSLKQFGFQICCFRWMKAVMTMNSAQSSLFLVFLTNCLHSVC